ncbi:MAG: SOS response-associated peptidase [Hyphomicrobiaceae bacterium]|nr:SOS response-associated peptidase [Hyphomicrobiaceae bacterium]
MCGRITQKSNLKALGLGLVEPDADVPFTPRYNGAPGQLHWVIRQNPETGARSIDTLFWGLIPRWVKEAGGGRKPINAKSETIAELPSFRDAYKRRRCIVPVDSFFEWKPIAGSRAKQPFAIGMRTGHPFALAGIWENWKRPGSEEWMRSFCVITTEANAVLADVHDRMPVILSPEAYDRWLSPVEPDPRDLLRPYPAEAMTKWAISSRVGKPAEDDAGILEPIAEEARSLLDAPPGRSGQG